MRAHIIIFASLLLAGNAWAQQISVELKGGIQGLQYELENSESRQRAGGGIHVGYTSPLNNNWQILTGIGGEFFNTRATLKDGAVFSSNQVDETGSAFQQNITTRGYMETQQFFAIGIPVKLQYHTRGKIQWYANGGFRFVLPFTARLRASANEVRVSGYYPDYNIEVKEMPEHGFGTITNWSSNSKQVLNPAVALSGTTGISFRLTDKVRLYSGLYADYGLTNMRNGSRENTSLVRYNPGNANQSEAMGAMRISNRARLIAYGVEFKFEISDL